MTKDADKKLFLVTIETSGYVLAKSAAEARYFAPDIFSDNSMDACTDVEEVSGCAYLADGWDEKCLVYGSKQDATLGEAMAARGVSPVPGMTTTKVPAQVPVYTRVPPLGSDGA